MIKTSISEPSSPSFFFENQHIGIVAGVDEVGCGPWAGPLVAAAVILYPAYLEARFLCLIQDSKQLSAQKRITLFHYFKQECQKSGKKGIEYTTAQVSVEEIDRLTLGIANRLAMERAVTQLTPQPDHVLIDGIRRPTLPMPLTLVKKGDCRSLSIAAASIIAKVTRDDVMKSLHSQHPFYGWNQNAGYGTKQHQDALKKYGLTPHHRKSFTPIQAFIRGIKRT